MLSHLLFKCFEVFNELAAEPQPARRETVNQVHVVCVIFTFRKTSLQAVKKLIEHNVQKRKEEKRKKLKIGSEGG